MILVYVRHSRESQLSGPVRWFDKADSSLRCLDVARINFVITPTINVEYDSLCVK
jgi:hypothetical protein